MIEIRKEIEEIETGKIDKLDNPVKNSPHTYQFVTKTEWAHPYSRERAAYPLQFIINRGKYWPPIGRIDNVYGDLNLVCTCPDIHSFAMSNEESTNLKN